MLLVLAAAGLGLLVALALPGPARAFPEICNGTACHGSATDNYAGVPVCQPGSATYWEDSYLPANAQNPHLTAFSVTPKPPCTGATVSAPKVDPWPATTPGPDGKTPKPPAGKADFRVTWTVTVPADSKPSGTMTANWSIAWTEPASGGGGTGQTETVGKPGPCPTTGTFPAHCRYDLEMQVSAPSDLAAAKAPQRFEITLHVYNNGPAASPAIPLSKYAPRFGAAYLTTATGAHALNVTKIPPGCGGQDIAPSCPLKRLPAHGEESFTFTVLWTTANRAAFQQAHADKQAVSIKVDAYVNIDYDRPGDICPAEETTCRNNRDSDEFPVR